MRCEPAVTENWQQGDAAAFEEIVRRWEAPISRFLARLCDAGLVADLCQEVFLRVYQARGRYRENGTFSTWIYRIALNVARDAARRQRHTPEPLWDHEPPAVEEMVSAECERRETAHVVASALGELPSPLREVLVLRHYEDMSFEQMARLLGTPASTLKSRFAVALDRLRKRLEQLGLSNGEDD